MASMRFLYAAVSALWCKRFMAWVDLRPSACSKGATKVWNISRTKPWALETIPLSSVLTRVVKTIG